MADIALDANILIGLLDSSDVHNSRAEALYARIRESEDDPLTLDLLQPSFSSCGRACEPQLPDSLPCIGRGVTFSSFSEGMQAHPTAGSPSA